MPVDVGYTMAARSLIRPLLEDLRSVTQLVGGYLATSIAPARFDATVVPGLVSGSLLVRDAWVRRIADRMRIVLTEALPNADFPALAAEFCRMFRENQWMRWRAIHRRGLPVATTVIGLEHLERARARGHGALLWGMSFCETLVVKIGLHRAGVQLVHLSTAHHGAANPPTWLGLHVVAPIFTAAELPYLAERIVIPPDQSLGYMRLLMDRLAANGCVSIAGDGVARRQNVPARVLGREAHFAPGAPGLAWKLGSALLPLHVVREGPLRYRVVIDGEIEVPRDSSKAEFLVASVAEFGRRLERRILERPSDFAWYSHLIESWVQRQPTT